MAQILVPVADLATGSWTVTPLWSKVDDDSTVNPSGDGTTISSDNNTSPDNADLDLAAGTDPNSSTDHILRARWNKDSSGGHVINAVLELWQGTPGTGTLIATLSVVGIGILEVESTYTLTGTEADSITDYSALNLRLSRQGDTGGNPNGRRSLVVDLVEFEIPDAGAAPVTIQASPATLSTAAQAASPALSALSVQASPATLTPSAEAVSPSPAALAIQAASASLGIAAQPADPILAALAVQASPAELSLAAQVVNPSVSRSPVVISAVPATLLTDAQAASPSLAALVIAATPATLATDAQVASPQVAGAPVTIAAVPAVLTLDAEAVAPVLAATIIGASPATLATQAQAVIVVTAAKVVQASPALLVLSARAVNVVSGEQVNVDVIIGRPRPRWPNPDRPRTRWSPGRPQVR